MDTVYNKIAYDFDRTRIHMWPCVKNFYETYVNTNDFILDVGCGNGKNVYANRAIQYQLFDVTETFLALCTEKYPGSNFTQGSVVHLPFRRHTFDIVLCVAVLHHIQPAQQRRRALHQLCLVAKRFVFGTVWSFEQNKYDTQDVMIPWTINSTKQVYQRFYHLYTKSEIEEDLKSVGKPFTLYYEHTNWVFIVHI